MAKTKEEKFLLALYKAALALGDLDAVLDSIAIGRAIGLHEKGTQSICNQLARTNFIKKREGSFISLTSQAVRLCEEE